MKSKSRFLFNLILFVSLLIIFSCLGVANISAGSDFNIPIYIQTSAGLQKAGYYDLVEILFNHNFEIQYNQGIVPDQTCSLRAEGGSVSIDGLVFEKNSLSFNLPSGSGKGVLTSQKDKNRFSLNFDIKNILETNPEKLAFNAVGKATLNKKSLNFNNIIVIFDKTKNLVSITGSGDKNFQATGLKVTLNEGCQSSIQNYYLLVDNGLLGKSRSADEVVKLLKQYPQFIDIYWNLEKIHKPKWWIHIPKGNPGSIWTTRNDCGNYEQDVNEYNLGEYVYINGANFIPGEYDWAITGMPGNASCDPNIAVAVGQLVIDETGAFCFKAYQIQEGDCKTYQVNFNNKKDNYYVIPEFTSFIGIITLLGAVGLFFYIRRK